MLHYKHRRYAQDALATTAPMVSTGSRSSPGRAPGRRSASVGTCQPLSSGLAAVLAAARGATALVAAGLDLGHSVVKDAYMTSETNSVAKSGHESVVIASLDSYRRAGHMLASLGRGFRRKARQGGATAAVVRGNPDGSLKVTESRVLTAGEFTSILIRVSLSWTVGFMGLFSILRGARDEAHAAHVRKGHIGSDEHRAHEILAKAGPHAALALVRGENQETRQMVAAAAADSARDSRDGPLTEFLAALDPGSAEDWVRVAVGEPSSTNR